jgi:methylphosphotriester-DNA--protein-cysteine methyltransferase
MATQEHINPGDAETRLQWNAVLERDLLRDGVFFFGVRSTGIYYRPSRPSRRPRRNQVRFFRSRTLPKMQGFGRVCDVSQTMSLLLALYGWFTWSACSWSRALRPRKH